MTPLDAKKNKEEEIKEKRTDETFKCQKCSFKTDSKVRLKSHIDNIHEMHTCDACDYKTPFLANLNIHKEDVHNKSTHGRDFFCETFYYIPHLLYICLYPNIIYFPIPQLLFSVPLQLLSQLCGWSELETTRAA